MEIQLNIDSSVFDCLKKIDKHEEKCLLTIYLSTYLSTYHRFRNLNNQMGKKENCTSNRDIIHNKLYNYK